MKIDALYCALQSDNSHILVQTIQIDDSQKKMSKYQTKKTVPGLLAYSTDWLQYRK